MENELLSMGAAALRTAALNEEAKAYILANPVLFRTLKKAADRYIGGETLEETIAKVQQQNQAGFKCSIEFMGESTRTEAEAAAATAEFFGICREIAARRLNSTISLDLSHIGLAISADLCAQHLDLICAEAAKGRIEVTVSAEGAERTDAVLETYKAAAKRHSNLAVTLQAYLHRTRDDFAELVREPGRIRMVKGAFATPEGVSLPRGDKLDEVYLEYVDRLLSQRHLCAIATHHDEIQQRVKGLICRHAVPADAYEFESLFGIQNEQLAALKAEGYPTKLYFVYGKEWYLYLCNRIAEYPLYIFRALKDIVE